MPVTSTITQQISHIQRIQKTLKEANIKLDSVISDILGASGRRMIEADCGAFESVQARGIGQPAHRGVVAGLLRAAARAAYRSSPLHATAFSRAIRCLWLRY
jgi:hypothetical protein